MANFITDDEKMRDFWALTKEEFLRSYSYLTEEEYDETHSIATKHCKHNAGYTIIAEHERTVGGHIEGVALAYMDKTYIGREFVTWEFTEFPGSERSYFWGHYMTNDCAAWKDYFKRIDKVEGRF